MIRITVVSYNNEVPAAPVSVAFGREGGTLGRSKDNFFVLDDPRNLVSRTQALVKSDGARHAIINLSHANPILLNGQEIEAEREYDLQTGDEIQIGLYLLRAEAHSGASGSGAQVTGLHAAVLNDAAPVASDPNAAPGGIAGRRTPSSTIAAAQRPAAGAGNFTRGEPAPGVAGVASHPPFLRNQRPAPEPASESLSPATAVAPAVAQTADHQALMQAFLNGAGIPTVTLTQGLTPELMEMVGRMLAISVQGTIGLSALRALVKREANADVTMVVVRNNNPLKFFPDAETVLMQMFRKKMPGFMSPTEAMQDAYEDLHAHQLGVVAGMRAAMADMLQRVDPEAQEKKVKDGSFFDSVVPANRKAKLWDSYAELFRAIKLDAQDDFHMLFGQAFLQAYEAEVERFKGDAENV